MEKAKEVHSVEPYNDKKFEHSLRSSRPSVTQVLEQDGNQTFINSTFISSEAGNS